jgi:hypothetical protein
MFLKKNSTFNSLAIVNFSNLAFFLRDMVPVVYYRL